MELSRTGLNLPRLGVLVFGALLWLQISASGLSRELGYEDLDWGRALLFTFPLVLLLLNWLIRSPLSSLLLYPVCVVGGLAIAPAGSMHYQLGPWQFVLVAMTMLFYVATASAWLQSPEQAELQLFSRSRIPGRAERWRPYRHTLLPRAVLLALAFAVTVASIPLSEPFWLRIEGSYGVSSDPRSVQKAVILCNLVMFFVWCVFAYLVLIGPTQELLASVRRIEKRTRVLVNKPAAWGYWLKLLLVCLSVVGLLVVLWVTRPT